MSSSQTDLQGNGEFKGGFDVPCMLSCAMMDTGHRKGSERDEEGLVDGVVRKGGRQNRAVEMAHTQARSARPSSQPNELVPSTARQ